MSKIEQEPSVEAPLLDVNAVVDFFGGVPALSEAAKTYNLPAINDAAIYKWRERGQIPGDWIVNLVTLAGLQRRSFSISTFITHTRKAG